MKTRRITIKLIAMVLAVTVLPAMWTIWGTIRAEAVIAIIRTTGVFSVAPGQTTTAHIVNSGEQQLQWDVRVLDSAGNTLAWSQEQMLRPGQFSSFDYSFELPEGHRMPIRMVLTVEGAANRNKPGFIATQEVYNTGDGRTTVFLPYIEQ